jgi:hypothetical protein
MRPSLRVPIFIDPGGKVADGHLLGGREPRLAESKTMGCALQTL